MEKLAVLLLFVIPMGIGVGLARYFSSWGLKRLLGAASTLGMAAGFYDGTTYTHGFDIPWWSKGLGLALLIGCGALGAWWWRRSKKVG